MQSRDFCYWLQGFFELTDVKTLEASEKQTQMIKNHLNMVFAHEITPDGQLKSDIISGVDIISKMPEMAINC